MALGDVMKLLQQASQMQQRVQEIQGQLAARSVLGTAGGGMVSVEADGTGRMKRVRIDPAVVTPDDVEMLEDLVLVAVSDAQAKAQDLAQQEMAKAAGGLDLPFKLPGLG
jgi:hypothetical protein